MKYGWRLTRSFRADGVTVLEWRCPKCWAAFRERRGPGDGKRPPGESEGK